MYADTDAYTQQLRTLENYIRQRPDSADARFVLAYQYLTCGYTDQAAAQLRDVVRLNPKDQLSAQLLASVSAPATPEQGPPPEQPPATPAQPLAAANLAGNWTATRPDGGKIALDLTPDGKYKWTYSAGGQTHDFAGTYDVADNLLILKQQNNPTMVGQVTPEGDGGFNFKMAGGSPNDPGLTFRR
jgi:protein involved in temperature-dependent protein secretion